MCRSADKDLYFKNGVGTLSTRLACHSYLPDRRHAGEFPRELFRKHGIAYELGKQTKSTLFRDAAAFEQWPHRPAAQ